MADDTSVEVKIIGSLDSSLQASTAAAKAQLDGIAKTSGTVRVSAAEMAAALQATGNNLAQVTPEMVGLGAASVSAAGAAENMAASGIKAAAAAETLGHGTAGVTREIIVLAHEMVQGRFSRVPGSLMVLTERMGGLSLATLGWAGAIAVTAGGLGYMLYESIEAEIQLRKLSDSFAMTGREAQFTSDYLRYQLDELSSLKGVNREAAQSYLGLIANMANINTVLENQVGQLLPAFINKFGDDGPKAAAKFAGELSSLSINGFRKMDDELLGLQPEQYAHIQNLIETGQTAQAVSAILQQLSRNTGVYVKSIGDQIYDSEQHIKQLKQDLASALPGEFNIDLYRELNEELEKEYRNHAALKKIQADTNDQSQAKKAIDLASQINNRLTERERLTKEIGDLEKGAALNKGNPEALRGINAALAKDRADAQKMDNDKAFKDFEQTIQQEIAAYKSGTSQRIALDQQAADKAKELLGEQSAAYSKWSAAVAQDKRAKNDQMVRDQQKASQATLDDARVSASEIINNDELSSEQRLSALRSLWSQLLSGGRLNAEQVKQATIEANREIAQAEKETLRDHLRDVAEATRQEVDAANNKSRRIMEAADQSYRYGLSTIQQETSALISAENERYDSVAQSLERQREAAAKMPDALQQIDRQIEDNKRTHERTMDDITRRSVDQMVAEYREAYAPITNGFEDMVQNMMGGQMTFWQVVRSGLARMVQDWIMANLRRLASDRITQAAMTAATTAGNAARSASDAASHSSFLLDLAEQLAKWLGLETSKTAATATGEAARSATTAANLAAGQALMIASGAGQISVDAAVAAAGAYAATAPIPYVGPILAPIAAATAYGEVMALQGALALGSAEGGAWEVGGGLWELHKEESVIPAYIASPMRDFFENGNNGGQASAPAAPNVTLAISAIDGPSVQRLLKRRTIERQIARQVGKAFTLSPSTRGAF